MFARLRRAVACFDPFDSYLYILNVFFISVRRRARAYLQLRSTVISFPVRQRQRRLERQVDVSQSAY